MPDINITEIWDRISGFSFETLSDWSFWLKIAFFGGAISFYYFLKKGQEFTLLRSEVMTVLFSEVNPIIISSAEESELRLALSNKLFALGTKVQLFEDSKAYRFYLKKFRGVDLTKSRRGLIGICNTVRLYNQQNMNLGMLFRNEIEKGLKIQQSLDDETIELMSHNYRLGR